MDLKSELLTQIRPPDFLFKGREHFSPETFLKNLEFALKNPKFMSTLFGVISLWSTATNPLNTPDPTPYLKNLMFGPRIEISYPDTSQVQDKPAIKDVETRRTETFEDKIFKNFSWEERQITEAEAEEQLKLYKKSDPSSQRAERVLDWEITTLEPILNLDIPEKDRDFWRHFISAIVYVESEGKNNAASSVGALGLTQIIEETAKETAAKHGILNFDLKKGWDSLRLGLLHFMDLSERYGPDISLLSYYAGGGFTDQRILSLIQANKLNQNDSIITKGIASDQQLHSYIDHYRINIANLGSSDGKEYLRKFLAAAKILDQQRRINPVQTTK